MGKGYEQFIGEIQIANKLMKKYFGSNHRNSNVNCNGVHFKISRLSKIENLINIKC